MKTICYYIEANDDAKAAESLALLKKISRNWEHNFIEYAFDYADAGLWEEAISFLKVQTTDNTATLPDDPLLPRIFCNAVWAKRKSV